MNKKSQNLIGQAIIFLVLWLVTSIIWSIWLDGFWTALAGCLTALAFLGVFDIVINIKG